MTLTLATAADDGTPDPLPPSRARRGARPRAQGRGAPHSWAVVEVHSDGSLGLPQMVLAGDPLEATAIAVRGLTSPSATAPSLPPMLAAHLGRSLAVDGRVSDAVRVLTVGALVAAPSPARTSCLAQLALA